MKVAVLGASASPDRFAYKAYRLLRDKGHEVYLVNPKVKQIEEEPVYASLGDLPTTIDTLTLYVGPAISTQLAQEILALKPRRVLFNPGSENPELAKKLRQAQIEVQEDCTLVLLNAGQF